LDIKAKADFVIGFVRGGGSPKRAGEVWALLEGFRGRLSRLLISASGDQLDNAVKAAAVWMLDERGAEADRELGERLGGLFGSISDGTLGEVWDLLMELREDYELLKG
jgi:hypothetical protein